TRITHEVPRRVDERVQRVRLALRRPRALRTGGVYEVGAFRKGGAAAIRHAVLGKHDRQVFFRYGNGAARGAMHDRDRRSPVSLPRDTPVPQPERDPLLAEALRRVRRCDRIPALLVSQAIELAGVDRGDADLLGIPWLPRLARIEIEI